MYYAESVGNEHCMIPPIHQNGEYSSFISKSQNDALKILSILCAFRNHSSLTDCMDVYIFKKTSHHEFGDQGLSTG